MHVWIEDMGATKHQWVPAKKPTRFMTNSRAIARELSRKCKGQHVHQPLVDGRAKEAARYPDGFCRAVCRGLMKETMQSTMHLRAVMEVGEGAHRRKVDIEDLHDHSECSISQCR